MEMLRRTRNLLEKMENAKDRIHPVKYVHLKGASPNEIPSKFDSKWEIFFIIFILLFFLSCCEILVSFLLPFFVFFFLSKRYHFIYSFDVFVHLDLHTIWSYMKTIHRMLLPNGKCFLSTSNLLAPLGWERFSTQDKYTVGGFYFTTPDAMRVRVFVACYWLLLLVVDCCCWLFGCFVASLSSRSIWLTFVFLSLHDKISYFK